MLRLKPTATFDNQDMIRMLQEGKRPCADCFDLDALFSNKDRYPLDMKLPAKMTFDVSGAKIDVQGHVVWEKRRYRYAVDIAGNKCDYEEDGRFVFLRGNPVFHFEPINF